MNIYKKITNNERRIKIFTYRIFLVVMEKEYNQQQDDESYTQQLHHELILNYDCYY